MKKSKQNAVISSLVPQSEAQVLSPIKVKFNTLIKRIEKKRAKLKALQDTVPILHQINETELKPLLTQYQSQQTNLMIQLDEYYQHVRLTKKEKKKLFEIIVAMSNDYIESISEPDIKIKEIYNRYNQTDYDQERADEHAYHKNILEEILGSKIAGDVDFNDMDSLMNLMSDKMQAYIEDRKAKEPPKRKKTAKQLEKEAKIAEYQDKISQSIQSVYRQLTSVLHPDRESDPAERIRKTELMQRVTIAYKEKNLLDLLTLQLEETQMDPASLDKLSEEKIHYYNQVLQDQSKELTLEINQTEVMLCIEFILSPEISINPKTLIKEIRNDILMARFACEELEEITELISDFDGLKFWLAY